MKNLKLYENFQTEQEITDICKKYGIENWFINSDGLVDVDENVSLSNKGLDRLPLNFGRVSGNFFCYKNNLTSLEGSPRYVGGSFCCNDNQLKSLENSPKEVYGGFYSSGNKLVSLEGGPSNVGRHFCCNHNELVSFEDAPDFVGGDFYCKNNPIFSIWTLFEDYSKIELFNYYDIIRELDGKPAIVLARLNQFLDDIGKPPVEKVDGYINI